MAKLMAVQLIPRMAREATLAVHTNNLKLGDGFNGSSTYIYGNGITIDDASMVTGSGLVISAAATFIEFVRSMVVR